MEEGSEEERKVILTAIVPNEDPTCLAYAWRKMKMCLSVSPLQVRTQTLRYRNQKYKQFSRSWPVSRGRRQIVMIGLQQRSQRWLMRRLRQWWESLGPASYWSGGPAIRPIEKSRNFRTVLAVGEWMFSLYKHELAGEPVAEVLKLCERYDIGKTKLYEVPWGGKYKKEVSTPKPESTKPARRVQWLNLQR